MRVFVSHSGIKEDMAFARKLGKLLVQRLNAHAFTTHELSLGENWETKLRNELRQADVVLVLLSRDSVSSKWVLHELGAAWAMHKPIIPVVTTRDILKKIPVALDPNSALEFEDIDSAEKADHFIQAFEDSLASAHTN